MIQGDSKSATSEMAGHTGDFVMRNRTLSVAIFWLRTSRQLPMDVPLANGIH
jgi:hypothetical protein